MVISTCGGVARAPHRKVDECEGAEVEKGWKVAAGTPMVGIHVCGNHCCAVLTKCRRFAREFCLGVLTTDGVESVGGKRDDSREKEMLQQVTARRQRIWEATKSTAIVSAWDVRVREVKVNKGSLCIAWLVHKVKGRTAGSGRIG